MARPAHTAKPACDPELIRELAQCYARAAVDAMLEEQNSKPPRKPTKPLKVQKAK